MCVCGGEWFEVCVCVCVYVGGRVMCVVYLYTKHLLTLLNRMAMIK